MEMRISVYRYLEIIKEKYYVLIDIKYSIVSAQLKIIVRNVKRTERIECMRYKLALTYQISVSVFGWNERASEWQKKIL